MKKRRKLWLIPVGILGLLGLCVVIGSLLPDVEPGPTRTPKPTRTATDTKTPKPPTFTRTPKPIKTPTDTETPRPTNTPKVAGAAASATPWPTITVRATWTITDTPAPAATSTPPSRSIGIEVGTAAPVKVVVDRSCSQPNPGNDNERLNEEIVCFTNRGDQPANLTGWRVYDEGSKSTYTFRAFTLAPGASVKLHTGSGQNTAADVYWNKKQAIWNNTGDTVYLYDASGQMADQWGY